MKKHSFVSHSPKEMRRLSNLGHLMEGILLAVVSILAILGSTGIAAWASTAWAVLILITGMLLLIFIYPLHPRSEWPIIWRDSQQRQHTLIAVALVVAGIAELLRGSSPGWRYVWPAGLLFIGVLFLVHTQHGAGEAVVKAVWQHRALGVTLMVAGLLGVAEVAIGTGLFTFLWPLALLVAAAQLLIYREWEGAYATEGDHSGHR